MYDVTLINMSDGSVAGHRTGCADIKKQARKLFTSEPWDLQVSSKADARAEYNADFDEEESGWYDIHWLPCANHVAETDEKAEESIDELRSAATEILEPVKVVTAKVGKKWTYLYLGEELIAELRNDQTALIQMFLLEHPLDDLSKN